MISPLVSAARDLAQAYGVCASGDVLRLEGIL